VRLADIAKEKEEKLKWEDQQRKLITKQEELHM
jgi:hypothetical protein